jgi:hypothetical protein
MPETSVDSAAERTRTRRVPILLFSIKWRNKALILNEFCRQWLNFDLSFELLLILLQILILFSK